MAGLAAAPGAVPDTTVLEADLGSKAGRTVGGILFDSDGIDQVEGIRRRPPGTWNTGGFATVGQYIPNGVLPERSNIMGLHLGDTAPDFTAMTTDGEISFHDWKQESWAVFFRHPADFTPVCTTELGRTAALKDEFAKRNTKAMALSIDPIEDHHKWAPDIGEVTGTELNFPIVADPDHRIAELYDMIHPGEGDTSTVRSVFIVDPANKLRLMLTYPK